MTSGNTARALSSVRVRRLIIEQSKRAHVGHIGSALSIADILVALYSGTIDPERDVFILSKGHAALAQYCVLTELGLITHQMLDTYCGDDTQLGVHPDHTLDGITFSTGSLGHGPSLGAGVALARHIVGKPGRVFVLMSDAELNEGSVWEAMMFAGHHALDNLTVILDNNGQQALARTVDVIDLSGVDQLVRTLGWECRRVDGHAVDELTTALDVNTQGKPLFVVADTLAGKGVSFMERQVKWHYLPVDDAQFALALSEIG
jgi:transketolase